MLYLGSYDDSPYVIHAFSAYSGRTLHGKPPIYLLNRVIVTDMSIGENSKKDSFIKRTTLMNVIN